MMHGVNVVVLGAGRMGQAIAYAMKQLGYAVASVDTSRKALDASSAHVTRTYQIKDIKDQLPTILRKENPQIVISSLPYFVNSIAGPLTISAGVRYCDLGGRVDVSEQINEYAKSNAKAGVFTDLGLAPGWVNIVAEEGCKKIHHTVDNVEMMVGGLPDWSESTRNPLRYGVTWSVDGLINEYRDDCIVLEDGAVKTVSGLDGLINVSAENCEKLEAFYTSGGASHTINTMSKRGVKNCSYRTLRYPGHRDIVKFLISQCDLSDDALEKIFLKGCGQIAKDVVIMLVTISAGDVVWKRENYIKADDTFSAMQKATAFPISAVASLMIDGKMEGNKDEHRDYWTQYPNVLTYADVPFDEFNSKLSQLQLL